MGLPGPRVKRHNGVSTDAGVRPVCESFPITYSQVALDRLLYLILSLINQKAIIPSPQGSHRTNNKTKDVNHTID